MNTNFYRCLQLAVMLSILNSIIEPVYARNEAAASTATYSLKANPFMTGSPYESQSLQVPFENTEYPVEQNNIKLDITNPNGRGVTEIYRSRSQGSGFVLVGTLPHDEFVFYDPGLNVRTTYYYRFRAVDGTETSPFSTVISYTTLSINYPPTFTAEYIGADSIKLTLTDNSANDIRYFVSQTSVPSSFYEEVEMLDSGKTVTLYETNVQPGAEYRYTVDVLTAGDEQTMIFGAEATVFVPGGATCQGAGSIERELWTNIPGTAVNSIPVSEPPDAVSLLRIFETTNYSGNDYGARIRGYVCPPMDGEYVFWIASDDASELYLSTSSTTSGKIKIASVSGFTLPRQWNKYSSQQSRPISLKAGTLYYIEALHKEASGGDHVAVGWKLPNGTLERPIAGSRLVKFNKPPVVSITSPQSNVNLSAGSSIKLVASANDPEGKIEHVTFKANGNTLFQDRTAPYEFVWNNVPTGEYTVVAVASDGQNSTTSASLKISVTGGCTGAGSIRQEFWTNVPGTDIGAVNFAVAPSSSKTYSNFETQQYWGNDYGSRMRAFLCPPVTGSYVFWISSDDNSQLFLSTDNSASNKKLISFVNGATAFRQYDKYPSQKSVAIRLEAGRTYYIEVLHKEGKGNDFISVGWQLPNGTLERPIAGSRLVPFDVTVNQRPTVAITSPADDAAFASGSDVTFKATATDPDGQVSKVEFFATYLDKVQLIGTDFSAPYEVTWNDPTDGNYTIRAVSTDNAGAQSSNAIITLSVGGQATCAGTGTVYREIWYNIPGLRLSDVPFDSAPDEVQKLSALATGRYKANDYGSRIRAYLCVPISGAFRFVLEGDDVAELWLSTDRNPTNKVKIAYLNRAVKPGSFFPQYQGQESQPIQLVGAQQYYIEVLHKEATGDDFVAVGWRFQNGDFEGPIPGNRLLPYDPTVTQASARSFEANASITESSNEIVVYPNPAIDREVMVTVPGSDKPNVLIELISLKGDILQQRQFETQEHPAGLAFALDQGITPGVYLIKVFTSEKVYTERLVIK